MGTPQEDDGAVGYRDDWKPSWEAWTDEGGEYDRAATITANPEDYPDVSPANQAALKWGMQQYDLKRAPLPQEKPGTAPTAAEPIETEFPEQQIEGDPGTMSAGEAYNVGARNPWNMGESMTDYGYGFLGDLFGEQDFDRKTTRGFAHDGYDIDPREHGEVAGDIEEDTQDKAYRDQQFSYASGQGVTEAIATAPLMATPFAPLVRGAPLAGHVARAVPSAGEMFAANAASSMPYGWLSGFGDSDEETLSGMANDAVEQGNETAAIGGTLGTIAGKAIQRGARPAAARQHAQQAETLGVRADRARTEAIGGTGVGYKRLVERLGTSPDLPSPERRIAQSTEELHPAREWDGPMADTPQNYRDTMETPVDGAQSFRDYAERSRRLSDKLGSEVGGATGRLNEALGDFFPADEFFRKLEAARPSSDGYGRSQLSMFDLADDMLGKLKGDFPGRTRAGYGEQRFLSPQDVASMKRKMDRIGYPDESTRGQPRGDEQAYAVEVANVARQTLRDGAEFAPVDEIGNKYNAANERYAHNELIRELSRKAAVNYESKPQYKKVASPKDPNFSGIEKPPWSELLTSPTTFAGKHAARWGVNKGLAAAQARAPAPDRFADNEANVLRRAQESHKAEAAMQLEPRAKVPGANPQMMSGFTANTGNVGPRTDDDLRQRINHAADDFGEKPKPDQSLDVLRAVEMALEFNSPNLLGENQAYGDRLWEAQQKGGDALAVELHKLSADKKWYDKVRPKLLKEW